MCLYPPPPPFSVWVIDFCFRISPTVFLSLDTCATATMKSKEETNELTALEGCQNTKSYKFKIDLAWTGVSEFLNEFTYGWACSSTYELLERCRHRPCSPPREMPGLFFNWSCIIDAVSLSKCASYLPFGKACKAVHLFVYQYRLQILW